MTFDDLRDHVSRQIEARRARLLDPREVRLSATRVHRHASVFEAEAARKRRLDHVHRRADACGR